MTASNDLVKLLSCPFCGSDAKPIYDGPSLVQISRAHAWGEDMPRGYWRVQCCKCGTSVGETRKQEEAVALWQTRSDAALEQAQRDLAEAREAIKHLQNEAFKSARAASEAEASAAEMQENCTRVLAIAKIYRKSNAMIGPREYQDNRDAMSVWRKAVYDVGKEICDAIRALPVSSGNYAKLLAAARSASAKCPAEKPAPVRDDFDGALVDRLGMLHNMLLWNLIQPIREALAAIPGQPGAAKTGASDV